MLIPEELAWRVESKPWWIIYNDGSPTSYFYGEGIIPQGTVSTYISLFNEPRPFIAHTRQQSAVPVSMRATH